MREYDMKELSDADALEFYETDQFQQARQTRRSGAAILALMVLCTFTARGIEAICPGTPWMWAPVVVALLLVTGWGAHYIWQCAKAIPPPGR
ncbi:hypothetical protein NNO07_25845 [Pseudomonas resinovorans]|uniref:2TM domain-containing protein n=1 Tax=Metapseudomonas resinovorans TaxID=53412 RepID=A0ABT4YD18_METRE|nr:hypothetical protein [Pseudomonas resinovorans]MDA8486504.1 hypothetical protein [Pseudomonas resinovorans]